MRSRVALCIVRGSGFRFDSLEGSGEKAEGLEFRRFRAALAKVCFTNDGMGLGLRVEDRLSIV